MTDFTAIAYTSRAVRRLDTKALDDLLIDARAFNDRVQVTGALLHHQGSFFQYFEGPPGAVARVYARIKASSQHGELIELLHQPIAARQFGNWHMAFSEAPATVLEELANEYWEMTLPGLLDRQAHSPGLKLLLDFWKAAGHGRAPD